MDCCGLYGGGYWDRVDLTQSKQRAGVSHERGYEQLHPPPPMLNSICSGIKQNTDCIINTMCVWFQFLLLNRKKEVL